MKEKKHNMEFEEFFRQSFDGAELTPSNKVWENIEQDLAQNESPRYRLAVWWLSGLAAMVLLSFFAYLLLWNPVAPTYSASSTSVATTAPTTNTTPIANNTASNITSTTVEPTVQSSTPTGTSPVGQHTVTTVAPQKVEVATQPTVIQSKVHSVAKKQTVTTTNKKAEVVKNATIVATNNNTNNTKIVAPLATEENGVANKAMSLPLAAQFNTLTPLPFQVLPLKNLKGEAILLPIQTPTTTTPQITATPTTQKSWIAINGFYSSYTPNFSNVKDSLVPNAYLTNSIQKGLYNYDQNVFAKDLNNLQGTTWGVGVEFGRKLCNNFGLKGGLSYTESKFQFDKTISAVVVTSSALVRQTTISNTTQQIGVPISAFYQKDWGKFTVGLNAGMQTDLLLSNTVSNSLANEGHTFNFGTYKTLTFSGLAGVQVGYEIVPRIQ
ncbi:MAG: hypothetical protein ACOVQA_13475, partial [Thermoflexibacteraceae bacterium]